MNILGKIIYWEIIKKKKFTPFRAVLLFLNGKESVLKNSPG